MLEDPSGWPIGRRVAASHNCAVLSPAPGNDRLTIWAERHGRTARARLRQGLADRPTGGGIPKSHVRRPHPVRTVLPSGLNAADQTTQFRMLHRRADGLAGGGVPQPSRLVMAAGEDRLAIRAEGNRPSRCDCGRKPPSARGDGAARPTGWPGRRAGRPRLPSGPPSAATRRSRACRRRSAPSRRRPGRVPDRVSRAG